MKNKSTGIGSWAKSERPRERLLKNGAATLKDDELIAIILRVGIQGKSAVQMGRELIDKFGSLKAMTEATAAALGEIKGLKNAKVSQLLAVMEIARRAEAEGAIKRYRISGSTDAKEYFKKRLRGLPEEHFRVLYLNRKNAILDDTLIAQGDTASVSVSLRRIVIHALQTNASALIAAHNHPSGAVNPSESDNLLTQDLIGATRLLGIKVLDHLIIGDNEAYSYANEGLIDKFEKECSAPGAVKRQTYCKKRNHSIVLGQA